MLQLPTLGLLFALLGHVLYLLTLLFLHSIHDLMILPQSQDRRRGLLCRLSHPRAVVLQAAAQHLLIVVAEQVGAVRCKPLHAAEYFHLGLLLNSLVGYHLDLMVGNGESHF